MFLFEVHEHLEPGFKLVLKNGDAMVPMGYDDEHKGPIWLPLGNSIESALRHPEDQELEFKLLHAGLDDTTSGLKLVAQTKTEARNDQRALVLVDGCTDPEVGVTNIAEAFDRTMPELITHSSGSGMTRRLYLFGPGDALFISWSARSLGTNRPKRFIIAWDGYSLTESLVSRPRRRQFRSAKKQEQVRTHHSPVRRQELHP